MKRPPKVLERLLECFLRYEDSEAILGDFEEKFTHIISTQGLLSGYVWYIFQILLSIPKFVKNSIIWSAIMLKNYIRIGLRIIKKHKLFSFINIFSLAIGIAGCILITLFVLDEYSFDKFHENVQHLHRVEQDQYQGNNSDPSHVTMTPIPMAPALIEEIPEIQYSARYFYAGRCLMRFKDKLFSEFGVRGVDSSFLEMFTFPFIIGDKQKALEDVYSVVLSENMAKKYFEDVNPIGKIISLNNRFDIKVTGVIKNVPLNSSIQFDMLIPFELLKRLRSIEDSWTGNDIVTFVQTYQNADVLAINEKISDLWYRKADATISEKYPQYSEMFHKMKRPDFMIQPITNIRLYQGNAGNNNLFYIRLFSVIAFFVLLIACINFMNLSTARSSERAKEIGMRKVVGAVRNNIIKQFFSEAITLSVLAFLLSLVLLQFFLTVFNNFTQKNLSLFSAANFLAIIIIVLITIFTGIVAGSYPALILSKFKPATVLKGNKKSGLKSTIFRRLLVIFQFTLFIIFMVCTITIYKQVIYLKNQDTGYNRESLSYIRLRDDTRAKYPILKNELLKNSHIINVTGTRQLPFNTSADRAGITWDGMDLEGSENLKFNWNIVDSDFMETMGIKIVKGDSPKRKYSENLPSEFLINEEVEKIMGVESAVGKRMTIGGVEGTIIGVVKNYNYLPLNYEIGPLVMYLSLQDKNFLILKLQKDNISSVVEYVESVWTQIVPDQPLELFFFEDTMNNMYVNEERMASILKSVSILVAVIACLGLFGLALFILEQRTKEIGIRKVLGSSMAGIFGLIIKDFFIWISYAFIISIPISYLLMKDWLLNFAYRIDLDWSIFLLTGLMVFSITLITISFQTIKVALTNPINSIRYE